MKLRHPWLIRLAARLAAVIIRLWMGTVRYRYEPQGPNVDPMRPSCPGRFLYAFWHENLLIPAHYYSPSEVHILISLHADGQLISDICAYLGFPTVRGSTTRGGVKAILQMIEAAKSGHLAITPDGPRGPRRQIQSGMIFLASQTGLPIVAAGIAYDRPWRARSWDRFAVPCPFRRARCVTGEPIHVPANLDRAGIEHWRLRVQQEMDRLSQLAEQLLEPASQPGIKERDVPRAA